MTDKYLAMKDFGRWLSEDYGRVMFAPGRRDVPKPPEPNTPVEQETWESFQKHYLGGRDADLIRNLPKIMEAKRSRRYADFLDVPNHYARAYRVMADVPPFVLQRWGLPIDERSPRKGILQGGTYIGKSRISSWTVNLNVMPELLRDFKGFYRRLKDSYHVLMVADLKKGNRDRFLINPDKYTLTPGLAGQFSYQMEVISVDSIRMARVAYCDKDEFGGKDDAILQWLMGAVK